MIHSFVQFTGSQLDAIGQVCTSTSRNTLPYEYLISQGIECHRVRVAAPNGLVIQPGTIIQSITHSRYRSSFVVSPFRSADWYITGGPQQALLVLQSVQMVEQMSSDERASFGISNDDVDDYLNRIINPYALQAVLEMGDLSVVKNATERAVASLIVDLAKNKLDELFDRKQAEDDGIGEEYSAEANDAACEECAAKIEIVSLQ